MSKATRSSLDPRKVSGELFTLTYGALVAQLVQDYEEDEDVNKQLDKMGYEIGLRLIDDFLSKNPNVTRCNDFREVADAVAKHGFRTYLGIVPTVSNWSPANDEFSLLIDGNPLTEFVEFPADQARPKLNYSQIMAGALRGALEQIQIEVRCWFVRDQLRGDPQTELRVKFLRKVEESVPAGDD